MCAKNGAMFPLPGSARADRPGHRSFQRHRPGIAEAFVQQGVRVAPRVSATPDSGHHHLKADLGIEAAARTSPDGGGSVGQGGRAGPLRRHLQRGPIGSIPARPWRRCSGSTPSPLLPRSGAAAARPAQRPSHRQHRRPAGRAGHSHYAASRARLQSIDDVLARSWRRGCASTWSRPAGCGPDGRGSLRRIEPALNATLPNRRVAEVADVANAVLFSPATPPRT